MAIFSNPLFATYSVYARNASIIPNLHGHKITREGNFYGVDHASCPGQIFLDMNADARFVDIANVLVLVHSLAVFRANDRCCPCIAEIPRIVLERFRIDNEAKGPLRRISSGLVL